MDAAARSDLAFKWRHVDVFCLLIQHSDGVAAQTHDGTSPLHEVSEESRVDVARVLIQHGADTTAQNEDGTTPLHQASEGPSSLHSEWLRCSP